MPFLRAEHPLGLDIVFGSDQWVSGDGRLFCSRLWLELLTVYDKYSMIEKNGNSEGNLTEAKEYYMSALI